MDKEVIIAALSSTGVALILRQLVGHWLLRGKVRIDQATEIRKELREEIAQKKTEISDLKSQHQVALERLSNRLAVLEAELEKAEDGRANIQIQFDTYRLDVYRAMLEGGASTALVQAVVSIPQGRQ